jgi:Ni/Fe-hydrogenase subunit HybB-like protein
MNTLLSGFVALAFIVGLGALLSWLQAVEDRQRKEQKDRLEARVKAKYLNKGKK